MTINELSVTNNEGFIFIYKLTLPELKAMNGMDSFLYS
jgi:hypothetical protein